MLSYEIDPRIVAGVVLLAIFLDLILCHCINCHSPKCKDTKDSIKNKKQKIKSIYPPLEDSELLELSNSEISELSAGEEEDLKEAAAEYEGERSGPIGRIFGAPHLLCLMQIRKQLAMVTLFALLEGCENMSGLSCFSGSCSTAIL